MFKKNIYGLAFILLILVFTALKLQTISLPYFWDELGVYVPGALKMKDNGTIGLLPSSLEPLYSRGHPLLFVFSQAAWFNWMGDTTTAGHAFSILLGIVTLIVFYLSIKNLFNEKIAFLSALVLAFQPMYYAMAGFILPEMMLTLFTIPALWGIVKNRWLVYAVAASLAMMTKESAIVIPAVAFLVVFVDGIVGKQYLSLKRFFRYGLALTPLFVYALFLIIQKKQNGWFFFPEHMGYLRLNSSLIEQGWHILKEIFFFQGKWLVCAGVILSLIFVNFRKETTHRRAINVFIVFVLACVLFGDLNFYLTRYMLYALPFVMAAGTYGFVLLAEKFSSRMRVVIPAVYVAATLFLSYQTMDTGKFRDTADMAYIHLIKTEREAIHWLEQQPWKDSVIEANFPMFQAMSDVRNGYLTEKPFAISVNFEKKAPYGIFFHFTEGENFVWNGKSYTTLKQWKMPYGFITAVKF